MGKPSESLADNARERGAMVTPLQASTMNSSAFRACQKQIEDDPLIHDLAEKKADIDKRVRGQSDHDRKVRNAAKRVLGQLVKQRFENEYDLVLSKRSSTFLYNKSQQVLDVTEKLSEYIRTTEVVIVVGETDG